MIATTRNAGDVLAARLFWPAFKFCNPTGMLPKLNVVTINHSLGAFLRSVVVIANDIGGLDEITIAANQVCSIVRHGRSLNRCQILHPSRCTTLVNIAQFQKLDEAQILSNSAKGFRNWTKRTASRNPFVSCLLVKHANVRDDQFKSRETLPL
jgi:hypothetical protein